MRDRAGALERTASRELAVLVDARLLSDHGLLVAFTERTGGVSREPYASLNLAAHVGDDSRAVDENRSRLLGALNIHGDRERLTTAEQVHGDAVVTVTLAEAGSGAFAASGEPPVPGADALLTSEADVPLMLLYADCVPVVFVATSPVRSVCVVHAGWRGALAGLPGKAAAALAEHAGCAVGELLAYIGPHIHECHYEVGEELAWRFAERFDTMRAARDRIDLGAVVRECLWSAGLPPRRIVEAGVCTAEMTERFYSHRAEGRTGRHAAVAAVLRIRA